MRHLPLIFILLATALGWKIGYTPCVPFIALILLRYLPRASVLECGCKIPQWVAIPLRKVTGVRA